VLNPIISAGIYRRSTVRSPPMLNATAFATYRRGGCFTSRDDGRRQFADEIIIEKLLLESAP
jgi:hypothetical protein